FCCGLAYYFFSFGFSLILNLFNKTDETGFLTDFALEMREFEVAMRIDKPGTNGAADFFYRNTCGCGIRILIGYGYNFTRIVYGNDTIFYWFGTNGEYVIGFKTFHLVLTIRKQMDVQNMFNNTINCPNF